MSNLNKILVGLGALIVIGLLVQINSGKEVESVNQQQETKEDSFHNEQVSEDDLSLNNTKSTLNTLLAEKKNTDKRIDSLNNENDFLRNKLGSLERQLNAKGGGEKGEYLQLQDKFAEMEYQIELLSQELKEYQDQSQPEDDSFLGINDNDLKPIGVTDYEQTVDKVDIPPASGNAIVDMIVQPAIDISGLATNDDIVSPIDTTNLPYQNSDDDRMVVIEQSDRTVIMTKEGTEEYVYPNLNSKTLSDTQPGFEQPLSSDSQLFGEQEPKKVEVPIYTVPQNSTFFGSVGMSAILGRVPIGNELSNPYRFKILIGSDNLASNNFFMPHLESMTASGYAEGDFTLECARGTVDKITFTFTDQTVREITGGEGEESLGWLSDAYGVPCISGEYLTNAPEFIATQSGLVTLSSFASSLADSAVTTTTSADGATTSVVNDASKKALGEGFSDGSNEIGRWYAERQQSAFDVVFVPTGEQVVLNIEKSLHIDYEPDGRKLVHIENGKEYLGW